MAPRLDDEVIRTLIVQGVLNAAGLVRDESLATPPSGGPLTSPLQLIGCQLWLDASQIEGLSDGDPVAPWPDLSGNGHHASGSLVASVHTVDITGASSGQFELSAFGGGGTTVPIPWDASAAAMQAALEALPAFGVGNVTVTLDAQVYTITFAEVLSPVYTMSATQDTLDVTPSLLSAQGYGTPNRPTYRATRQNGLAVVSFDSDDDFDRLLPFNDAATAALFNGWSGVTVAMVGANRNGNSMIVAEGQEGASFARVAASTAQASISFDDPPTIFASGAGALGGVVSMAIGVLLWDGQALAIQWTGGDTLSFTKDPDAVGSLPSSPCRAIGLGTATTQSSTQSAFAGDLAEIIVYNRALSLRERRLLLEFLSDKWGLL